jgi:two-component system, chemotaxis family, response regulator Rcp1
MVSLAHKIARSIKVLLVEDNLGDVTLIMEAFKGSKRDIQLTRVKDGVEALDYLRRKGRYDHSEQPDLILLDLNMPKKPGLEVLEEIKSDPKLKDIPVVVLTNSKLDTDVRKAYESRANFYMVKPTDLDELFVAMRYVEDIWLRSVAGEAD